ncbi:MAG TPA: type II CRISPR RNA-guided endonuclease Cas9, partial [Clostridia bacterium]|nr:type II CRISPR RNA-guided endonuclease Cas9 [Clostridia bacterium]
MKYTLGLDIGISSVGWAVLDLDKKRIEALGVRVFDRAENPKDGSPLAEPRRESRGARRRIQRKAKRMRDIKKLFVKYRLVDREQLDSIYVMNKDSIDVWRLRAEALDRKLDTVELARVLTNIAKYRGYKSNSKSEEKNTDQGKVNESISKNKMLMSERGYRTVGEMMYKDENFFKHKHNKGSDYSNCIARAQLAEEIKLIFAKQREFGSEYSSEEFEKEYTEIFNRQKAYATKEDILKKIGFCTFENKRNGLPDRIRAAKNTYTSEYFVLLQKVNNLSVIKADGTQHFLDAEERQLLINEAFKRKELKYSDIRKLLTLDETDRFAGVSYRRDEISESEKIVYIRLTGYHEIKSAVKKHLGEVYWNNISRNADLLDLIAFSATICKTDDERRKYLLENNIPPELIEPALELSFSKFLHLSDYAIKKIIPFLEQGMKYNSAYAAAGYDFQSRPTGEKSFKLPPIDSESINNPVVIRALAQSRKVINLVIDRYGSPYRINIELARDMGKSKKLRDEIKKQQDENYASNEQIVKEIGELVSVKPTGIMITKYKLWKQQNSRSAYSLKGIDPERMLLDSTYTQVDHIIPYSDCFDDSMNNKVLVLTEENQNKRDRLPFEYLGLDTPEWEQFKADVSTNPKIPYLKKQRLLRTTSITDKDREEWKARNLNDTRWITRELSNHIRNYLFFEGGERYDNVICVSGRITDLLRKRWGLEKSRE